MFQGNQRFCAGVSKRTHDQGRNHGDGDGLSKKTCIRYGGHILLSSFLCLLWFLFRVGTKPSRITYPCQKAALAHSGWFLGYILYCAGILFKKITPNSFERSFPNNIAVPRIGVVSLCLFVTILGTAVLSFLGQSNVDPIPKEFSLSLPSLRATVPSGVSDIFAAAECPKPSIDGSDRYHEGLDALLNLMGQHGLMLYNTSQSVPHGGSDGLIRADDVVLIKINYQWDERGGTNTDVLKGLTRRILEHPDGFTGEVVVVENIQVQPEGKQITDFEYPLGSNAELHSQSPRAVIEALKAEGYEGHVSGVFWANFRYHFISEDNHVEDGYVVLDGALAYPKFTTENGHRIDLKRGLWNGSGYEDRVRFMNMPVLKDHGIFGVTASSKNYMGVPTVDYRTIDHSILNESGYLGRMMVHIRYPDLNIIDAIYVNAASGGPYTSYDMATNLNILLAGTDPVGLDYFAGKYVLSPVSGRPNHHPDAEGIFREYLQSTADTLRGHGFQPVMGDSALNVYVANLSERPNLAYLGFRMDDTDGNGNGELNRGETADLIVSLENEYFGAAASGIVATLFTEDQEITVVDNAATFDNISAKEVGDNAADPFVIRANDECSPHWAEVSMIVETDGGYVDTLQFSIPAGDPVILLVDDDGGEQIEDFYEDAFRRSGYIYSYLNRGAKALPISSDDYRTIVWFTGACSESTLTAEDQAFLASTLDSGGSLFLSGQNIGYDLVEQRYGPDFYSEYLHTEYIGDAVEESFLCGVQGDPISGAFTFFSIDVDQTSPSVLAPRDGASPVLVYQISRDTAGIKYEGDHRVVYFGLGFEGMGALSGSDEEMRKTLLQNIIRWFDYVPTQGDVTQDGGVDILDVLATVNIILGLMQPTPTQSWAADCTADGLVNIIDVVGIVNVVLGLGTCPPTGAVRLSPVAVGYLQRLQSYLSSDDFALLMSMAAGLNGPADYRLSQNYPNPFNPRTSIAFTLPSTAEVRLTVYNILGQEVDVLVDGRLESGSHAVSWDARDMASGVYYYRLTATGYTETKCMLLMK
ncbi:MAG: DUF362 domain-containing protein [Gemmatimonadota bacterium]|nr:MAG: DUF362 domain-containing protein [Gemmatimonadota bacterium]